MKKISLLFSFVIVFATASFAGTSTAKDFNSKLTTNKEEVVPFVVRECTVTVSWPNGNGGTNTITVTSSCNSATCTTQQACNQAYALTSVFVPGA